MLVPSFATITTPRRKNIPLPLSFKPGGFDVQCGRSGKKAYCSTGNRRFRLLIRLNLDRYGKATTKLDKSLVVISIIDMIRSKGGGFVKLNIKLNQWFDIGDQLARDKVGHALRDGLADMRKKQQRPLRTSVEEVLSMEAKELAILESAIDAVVPPSAHHCPKHQETRVATESRGSLSKEERKESDPSNESE